MYIQPGRIFGCHFLYLKNQHLNATVISCKVYIILLIQVIPANMQIWLINAWVVPLVDCMITQKPAPRRMKSPWKGGKQCLITKILEWQKGHKTFQEEYLKRLMYTLLKWRIYIFVRVQYILNPSPQIIPATNALIPTPSWGQVVANLQGSQYITKSFSLRWYGKVDPTCWGVLQGGAPYQL